MKKTYIYCKKDFIRWDKILFHKNKKYYYYNDFNCDYNSIFILYNEGNTDFGQQGYTLYFSGITCADDSPVYDFFYTKVEEIVFLRKKKLLKLKKINEIRI